MAKKIFTLRVFVLIFFVLISLIAINPNPFAEGVEIQSVDGIAAENGLMIGAIIESFNGKPILTIEEFNDLLNENIGENASYVIRTDLGEAAFITSERPDIAVREIPKTNIKKGLDLAGGTRALIKPVSDSKLTDAQINDLIDVLNNRLNTYGLSDLDIRSAKNRDGEPLVLIEIAGASREEVKKLIEQQGQFEARIGNRTVFVGGEKDVTYVCKDDGSCSGIQQCLPAQDGYSCRFEFAIHLSPSAAKKHAEITKDIPINVSDGAYLSEQLDLYLDDILVDSLLIGESLKGVEASVISISGPGFGAIESDAYEDALQNMNQLQTVLITGSLPFELENEKLDSISPIFGKELLKNSIFVGIMAILSVCFVVFLIYRKLKIVIPMVVVILSEVVITLGVAALIQWRLDLVSIAGIITAVGTGVNDQIIITDEVLREGAKIYNWKERIKRAMFIIFAAYFAMLAAMLPLWSAGAGLIRGFAVTTIIGITVGVFITRPAFASIIERLLGE